MSLNKSQLDIEEHLILLLSRVNPSSEALRDAEAMLKSDGCSINYDVVMKLAAMNGVTPLLYRKLNNVRGVPGDVLEKLKNTYLATFSRNLHHSRETMKIINLLREAGIDTIPLKGSLFSDMVLGDIGLYPTGDIDLLVRPLDLEKTKKTLMDAGYKESIGVGEEDLLESSYHLIFHNDASIIEIHWNLVVWFFKASPDLWWADALKMDYEGEEIQLLSPERYLLYAMFHLFTHGFRPLKWFLVISGLADKYRVEMDWAKLLSCAEELRMTRLTLFTLRLVHDLLGADIPPAVAKKRIAGYHLLRRVILSGLFREVTRSYVRLALFTTLMDTPLDTAGVLLRRVFPNLSEIRLRYGLPAGSKKVYLYYLVNPLLLFLRKR